MRLLARRISMPKMRATRETYSPERCLKRIIGFPLVAASILY
jgi:hypothetical protein